MSAQQHSYQPVATTPSLSHRADIHASSNLLERAKSTCTIELTTWLLGTGCFAAIVGVLVQTNGTAKFMLPGDIQTNALVSTLAQVGSMLLAVSLSASLSQFKWSWLKRPRPLNDYAIIEHASKGPIGSFLLLVKVCGGVFPIFGALLTILALALPPFAQQALAQQKSNHPLPGPPLPLAHYAPVLNSTFPSSPAYPNNSFVYSPGISEQLSSSFYLGWLAKAEQGFNVSATCPTNHCTWDAPYQTLAVCHTCLNVTDQLKFARLNLDEIFKKSYTAIDGFQLPNGFHTLYPNGMSSMTFNVTTALPRALVHNGRGFSTAEHPLRQFYKPLNFSKSGAVLADIYMAGSSHQLPPFPDLAKWNTDPWGAVAYNCKLQLCVQTYTAEMKDQNLVETPVGDPWFNDTPAAVLPEDLTSPPILFRPASNITFEASGYDIDYFRAYLAARLNGQLGQHWGSGSTPIDDLVEVLSTSIMGSGSPIDMIMGNIARSLTKALRELSRPEYLCIVDGTQMIGVAGLYNHFERAKFVSCGDLTANGTALEVQVLIMFDWVWLSLPAVVIVAALGLLLTPILRNRQPGAKLWEDDNLAGLLHNYAQQEPTDQIDGIHDMQKAAKEPVVQLEQRDGRREQLVFQASEAPELSAVGLKPGPRSEAIE